MLFRNALAENSLKFRPIIREIDCMLRYCV